MASMESSRYHLLQDPRASMDSNNEDESARLIDPAYDNTAAPSNPHSTVVVFHPTIVLRALAFLFGLGAFIGFAVRGNHNAIGALVFLPLAMTRQVVIIMSHYVGKIMEIRIDVTNPAFQRTSFVKKVGGLPKGLVPILIDVFNLCGLVASITVGMIMSGSIEGGVLGYFAIISLLLAIVDTGNPSTVTATLQKPAGAAWEVARVGRTQAEGPHDADLAKIFGKAPPEEVRETSPVPGPSVPSIV